MEGSKPKKDEKLEEKLPLILEIIPGQAHEGLMTLFEAGEWENKKIQELVKKALKEEVPIEERELIERIRKELEGGGKLLYQGKEVDGNAANYAIKEKTEAGEDYYYISIRVIKPQEGGFY